MGTTDLFSQTPDDEPEGTIPAARVRKVIHETNNPLMAISGMAELVLRTEPDLAAENVQRLQGILSNCDRIADLLRGLRPARDGKDGKGTEIGA